MTTTDKPTPQEALAAALRWFENELPGVMVEMGCPDESPWLFDPAWVAQARAVLAAPTESAPLAVVPAPSPSAGDRFDAAVRAILDVGCTNAVQIVTKLGALIAEQVGDAVRVRRSDPSKVEPIVLDAIDATLLVIRTMKGIAKSL